MLSKNKELFWIGGLYKPTMNHFLERMLISRNIASLSMPRCKFNCLAAIDSLTYMQSPPPEPFLSRLNILYPFKQNSLFGKESSNFVSETRNMSKIGLIIVFKYSNLFLTELIFR